MIKLIKALLVVLFVLFMPMITIAIYDHFTKSTPLFEEFLNVSVTSNKNIYNLGEDIVFNFEYLPSRYFEDKVKLKVCDNHNLITIVFRNIKSNKTNAEFDLDNFFIKNKKVTQFFSTQCPLRVVKNNGFIIFNSRDSKENIQFKMKFIKNGTKYYLIDKFHNKIELEKDITLFTEAYMLFNEPIMAEYDSSSSLKKYLIFAIKNDKLEIKIK